MQELTSGGAGERGGQEFANRLGSGASLDSASRRYFAPDLIEPGIEVRGDGTIRVPDGPGIGVAIDWDRVDAATEERLERRR